MRRRPVLLYDDDCGFCRWSANLLRRWDRHGRLVFATIQASDDLLGPVPSQERLVSVHLVGADGRVWSGGAAFTQLAGLLPGGAPLATIGRAMPATTDRLYRFVAGHRTALGRLLGEDACRVDPAGARR